MVWDRMTIHDAFMHLTNVDPFAELTVYLKDPPTMGTGFSKGRD